MAPVANPLSTKNRTARDLARILEPLERCGAPDRLRGGGIEMLGQQRRIRADAIDPHLGRQLEVERAGHVDQSRLGDEVGQVGTIGAHPRPVAEVHDVSALARLH
jgi:hypothetical protein